MLQKNLQTEAEHILLDYLAWGNDPKPTSILHAGCFEDPRCRSIFGTITALIASHQPADHITISKYNKQADFTLFENSYYRGMDINYYVSILYDTGLKKALKLQLRTALEQLEDTPPEEVKNTFIKAVEKIAKPVSTEYIYDSRKMVAAYDTHIKNLQRTMAHIGIAEIDREIRGIAGGEVLTILGRAGSFKTAFLQYILRNYTKVSGAASVFFSLEMPVASVTERYFQIVGGYRGLDVYDIFSSDQDVELNNKTKGRIAEDLKNIYIIDRKVSVKEIPIYIHTIENTYKTKVGMVGIDYLGMLQEDDEQEYAANSRIARGVKELAKSENIPVVLLSQVSRKGGEGETEISMSFARGSGVIEEAADFILTLWQLMDGDNFLGLVCYIAKNRKGRRGTYWQIAVNPENFRFQPNATKYEPPKRQKVEDRI